MHRAELKYLKEYFLINIIINIFSYLIVLIAYKCSDFVNYLTSGLYLIVNPIARFLDYLLGGYKPTRFEKKDLRVLIELHEVKKD